VYNCNSTDCIFLISGGSFYFRVKFYVSDPSKLLEDFTRYHLYLQLKKDILSGKLLVSPSTVCLLASYTVQCKQIVTITKKNNCMTHFVYILIFEPNILAELGDYNPEEHKTGYLSGMILIPGQTEQLENQISELHKLHK